MKHDDFGTNGRPGQNRRIAVVCVTLGLAGALSWLSWNPELFEKRWGLPKRLIIHKGRVEWTTCLQDPSFQCAYLEVPTDYFNASAGTSVLALSKYPAPCPASERLGSIFTNFGGPGVPGRQASFIYGPLIRDMVGGRHDIISWDQRGLGHSRPLVNCFNTSFGYQAFMANTVLETSMSLPRDPFSPEGKVSLVEQQRQALALEEAQAKMCGEALGAETLRHMGTTTTIRDMEEISRILEGEDARINFWGGSYGTIVGDYLANMLPHKAGRIFIDGVAPASIWANSHYENFELLKLLLQDSEKTFEWFVTDCYNAGPTHCEIASEYDTSPSDVSQRIDGFLDKLRDGPVPVLNGRRQTILSDAPIRIALFHTLQDPVSWKQFTTALALAINKQDYAALLAHTTLRTFKEPSKIEPDEEGVLYTGQEPLWRLAISCGDAAPYRKVRQAWPTPERMAEGILELLEIAPRFGASVHLDEQHGGCQFWPSTGQGPERFTGPWNATLRTPVLISSNSHDPVTPVAAGRFIQAQMGNSTRHLILDSPGHSYLSPKSECGKKIIREYFTQGKIPDEHETFCKRGVDNYFTEDLGQSSMMDGAVAMMSGTRGLRTLWGL